VSKHHTVVQGDKHKAARSHFGGKDYLNDVPTKKLSQIINFKNNEIMGALYSQYQSDQESGKGFLQGALNIQENFDQYP